MIIVVSFLVVFLIGVLIHTNDINETYSLCCVFVVFISAVVYILKYQKEYGFVLLTSFLIRLIILFADYYKLFPIIGSGSDTEFFYEISVAKAIGKPVDYLTNYTVFLTYLFKLIGPQRLFAQLINVLCSFGTIIYIIMSIKQINIKNNRIIPSLVLIASFTPQVVLFSGVLLRESLITFFLSISVYYFIRYIQTMKIWYTVAIFGSIFVCTFFHTGMIMGLLGYAVVIVLYSKQKRKLDLSFIKIAKIIVLLYVLFSFVTSVDIFTDYFDSIMKGEDSEQALLDRLNYETKAGSAYLSTIKFDTTSSIILLFPIKEFYFLFSPLPWDFRNFVDVLSFILDSCIFFFLFYVIIKNKDNRNGGSFSLILLFFFLTILYALGTTTAGTAIRHRDTIMPVLIVAAALSCIYKSRSVNK